MYDDFKKTIANQLSELSGVSAEIIVPAIDLPKVTTYGDLAIAVPRLRLKGNPVQLAQSFAEKFKPDEAVTSVVATGPYLNFRVNRTTFTRNVLNAVHREGGKYGWTNEGAGKRVIVEFSSPNIAKPFHAGHLRSTIIGNFIYNLYKANGWDAISMNYLGDWGKQYGLLAIGFNRFGSEEKLVANPITHLYEVYVAINAEAAKDPSIHDEARAYFKKMEDGDKSALALWQHFRDLSIVKYKETYSRLNIKFDVYSGESQVGEGMERAMKMLEDAGLIVEDKGAKIIDLTQYKLEKAVVQKSDGTTLYLTRDIGAALERYEKYQFDKIIYVVSSQQDLHLKQLFKTLELLKLPYADRFQHINYGMVKGMSTRKGTVVFLDDMLMESKSNMHNVMRENDEKYKQVEDPEHISDVLGISAMVVQDMSARRIKDYDFDWTRILSFEGDTGPYLQYAHARLCSLERKSNPVNLDADVSILTEETAREIVTLISRYPDVLSSAMQTLEPCTVVQYILKLSHAISAAWETIMVRDQPQDIADARLLMYSSARIVLGNALAMLGLEPVQRM
ncbi:arginyl-tRNA synthetase [Coemansia spiralis]|uniref:arginine--tRNA ligase n=2 Tax=Coemansia TaxID=4863 RepID=A0A9W8KX41_9FUNG|nr:arginyl-tRNA synthetase [Coemansia spiralis]KAJ1989057.1 arginyl-tRNA synthetase [Coemansia umbellata]KAJ2622327.1 arginyl-tRNA synthetase [Coemansia sp. RSA 1358]KAJ2677874.1 arginyl-tRNA synthetase [Coemansia spiralis]